MAVVVVLCIALFFIAALYLLQQSLRPNKYPPGITCTDGKLWHEQRSFAVRHLRKVGYGKESMEQAIQTELSELVLTLDQEERVRLGPEFAKSVLNVLWMFVAGNRLTQSCSYINKLLYLMDKRKQVFDMSGGKLSQMPWLRFVAPDFSGYSLITEINTALEDFFKEIIEKHEQTHSCRNIRDFIDAYLHQMHDEEEGELKKSFTVDQLIVVCLDFFIAGSQTTSNTLDFAFLLVLLHPDIQKKVREEICSVVGTERRATLSDRTNMPYVEAVLMETQRLCTIVPLIGPRRVLKDTTLGSYNIPKDTVILANAFSVHMDEDHWKDPYVFRPERFLDENGAVRADEWFMPFGLGRRRCLGDALARSCIFLFFTGVLQHFEVLPDDDKALPSIQPLAGITMSPQSYCVRLARIHDKSRGA
ncbi:probable cytochrome P450 305a1 isoform X2 [Anabrus simplex]|uniref:probable cytochrome P450 305a1 isoform X2 n=1 Tax=Anabrus simplex TaxID=316456 RepID=UPI0034DD767C